MELVMLLYKALLASVILIVNLWIFGSRLINYILDYLHPCPISVDGTILPTTHFSWPNGQGTEKFFDGRKAAVQWRARLGPIYRIWSGFTPEIVLSTTAHVQEFYKDSHKHIKAGDNNAGWLFQELLGECVGVVSLQRWRNQRQHFDASFTRTAANGYTNVLISQARHYVQELKLREDETINPANDLKHAPFLMVATVLFGPLSHVQSQELLELAPLREDLFRVCFKGGVNRIRLGRYLPWSASSSLRKFQKRWTTFVDRSYQQAKQKGFEGPVVHVWESAKEGSISFKEVLQTLDESLYANLDVTANATAWAQILLAQDPNVQTELREEIQSIDNSDSAAYANYINSDTTFLAACILESSRVRPILPFSNPESATGDKFVGGFVIPRKTNVIVDTYAINVVNPFWENGARYDPHRHLLDKRDQTRYNLWRFGFGPRQCLGKNVADRILRAITAELVLLYDLTIPKSTNLQDCPLQEESWIGLPDARIVCTMR